MDSKVLSFSEISIEQLDRISMLGQQLNPNLTLSQIRACFVEMFEISSYRCFGLFHTDELIGISSGWITVRLYSGKQLEVDNVIIDQAYQSKGYGKLFFDQIEEWAKLHSCNTIELNTYVQNKRSHKFYYNLGYGILGFHFQKRI